MNNDFKIFPLIFAQDKIYYEATNIIIDFDV